MKIGFSIMSHQTPDILFKKLLACLNEYPDKEVAIHHDFHQAGFDTNLLPDSSYELVTNYVRTYWSHTNNIKAILETFKILFSKNCDWFVTLSGACFPVKSSAYITNFLQNTTYDGFIERNNVWTDHFDFYQYFRKGFQTKYIFSVPFLNRKGTWKRKVIRMPRNKNEIVFTDTFIPYHGSDWFIINRKCMDYLLDNEPQIDKMVAFLADVNKGPDINVCPPEVVFQTVLGNNKSLKLDDNYYRFTNWEGAKNWHPNTLTQKHWNALQQSDALFARKFNWEQSKELIALIDKEILHKQQ